MNSLILINSKFLFLELGLVKKLYVHKQKWLTESLEQGEKLSRI